MRKYFSAASALLLTSFFFVNATYSQDYAYHNPFPKTTLVGFMAYEGEAEKSMNTVSIDANLKLQKSFNKQFKNAGHVNWYNLKKDYLAVFDYEGRKIRALFTKNGYTVYSIAYGDENNLPKEYRKLIKGMYVDFDIVNAIELHSSAVNYTTWLALLRDDKNIVIARLINGGLDEFARYDTKPKEVKKQRKGRVIVHKTRT